MAIHVVSWHFQTLVRMDFPAIGYKLSFILFIYLFYLNPDTQKVKRKVFILTKHSMQIFRVILFFKLQKIKGEK